jgi:hypothetical protein
MATTYPTAVDTTLTFPTDITNDTDFTAGTPRTGLKGFHAQLEDDQNAAIVAIETTLGTSPQGQSTTVAARLDTLVPKLSVVAASTANVTLPPGGTSLTIDGVVTTNGVKVLLKDQTLPAANGVYTVSGVGVSVVLTRSAEADSDPELTAMLVQVTGGTAQADTSWLQTTNPPLTIGTTWSPVSRRPRSRR